MSIPVENRSPAPLPGELARELARHESLKDVLDWCHRPSPPLAIADVVTQDEYTHDIVIAHGPLHLVYDTS